MGRPGHIWFRSSRGRWYAKIGGKMRDLGTDRVRAEELYKQMTTTAAALGFSLTPTGTPGVRVGTVAELVPKYVADIRHRVKPKGATDIADRLAWLVRRFGDREPAKLDPLEVERQSGRAGWRRGTERQTLAEVQAFVRWAGAERFRLRIPPPEYRGHECVVTPAEFVACEQAATGDFRGLLRVLWETGARPGEVRKLAIEAVNWQKCMAVLREHKTAKTGRLRTILFSPAAMAVLTAHRLRYQSGPLFRGVTGLVMSMSGVNARWRALRDAGLVKASTIYATRHAFITERLEAGVPAAKVAALVGTSIAMIEKTYGHVGANIDGLRAVASRLDAAG